MHQDRVEAHLREDAFKQSNGAVSVEHGVVPESLEVDESKVGDASAHPIKVMLRHLSEEEANPELANVSGTKSGLFRSSLLTAEEEEAL